MNWRERINTWSDWSGWRNHAPAAGSVVAHVAVVAVFAGMMATVTAEDAPRLKPNRKVMQVELVQLPEAPPEAGVTPPPRAKTEPTPSAPADKRKPNAPSSAPVDDAPTDDNTFYVPSSPEAQPGVAQGLASVMGNDACEARYGPKAKECAGRTFAQRTGKMDSVMPRSPEQIAQFYGDYTWKCPYWSGCDGGDWKSTNGTRSVAKGDRDQPAMMGAGAATLGGLNATTGRLEFNPDFRDRGFGD